MREWDESWAGGSQIGSHNGVESGVRMYVEGKEWDRVKLWEGIRLWGGYRVWEGVVRNSGWEREPVCGSVSGSGRESVCGSVSGSGRE